MPDQPPVPSYRPDPTPPRLRLPAGACDAHVHVFGPAGRFPYAPGAPFVPADAPKETLFALHRLLGVERCVIVQSTCHGTDNAVVEDAIRAGGGRYLGVALVAPDVADAELARLAAAGFRGVRFNFMKHLGGGVTVEQVIALTARLAAHHMHLQVHFESSLVHALAPALVRSAVPVVVDHIGRVDASLGVGHADFGALCALLEDRRFMVKVSGSDRISREGPPYRDALPFARLLVERFPEQVLWGTDWPHPNHTHVPDDGLLVDLLGEIAPTPEALRALVVDNPARFYGFAS